MTVRNEDKYKCPECESEFIRFKFKVINKDISSAYANVTEESTVMRLLELVKSCVHEIHFGDEIYNIVDITEQELDDFFDSMTQEQFTKVQEFFTTMPRLRHVIKIKNPKTKVKSEITLEGLQDFFG